MTMTEDQIERMAQAIHEKYRLTKTGLPEDPSDGGLAGKSWEQLSQKLDGAWALFRSRFGQFLGLSFAISTPLYVLTAIAQRGLGGGFLGVWQAQLNQIENTAPNPGGDVFLAGLVAMAGSLPLFLLGVVIARVVRAALEGKVLKASGALRIGWRTLLAVLATWVVSRLIIGAGILVCFLPGLLAMAMLSISAPVIAFEDAGGVRSIGRSYGLTSRYFGTALACAVATAFMNMVVSMGTSGIVYAAAGNDGYRCDRLAKRSGRGQHPGVMEQHD